MSLSDILLEGIQPPKVYKQRPASMQIFAYEEYPFLPSPIVRVPTQERVRFDGYDINQGRSSKYGDADGGDDVDPLCTTPANQMQEVRPRGRSVGISEGMDGDMHDGGSPGDTIVMPKTHTGLGITF